MNSGPGLPSPSIYNDDAARRAEVASPWPTGESLGIPASELREAGQILGVYLPEPHPHYRYPVWQFEQDGRPVVHLGEILKIVREYGIFRGNDRRTTGWGEVEWFLSPHVLLDGECPADLLVPNSRAVLDAARIEFIEGGSADNF